MTELGSKLRRTRIEHMSAGPPLNSRHRSARLARQKSTNQRSLPPFAERNVMECWRTRDHSGLMLAARITLPHFSVSSAMSLPKSAGEPASTVPPKSASRALILGSARPALISLLSLSMISAGVSLGAPMPIPAARL